jgi:hypothetical protein
MNQIRCLAGVALLGGMAVSGVAQLKITNNIPAGLLIDLSTRPSATRLEPRLGDDEERAIFTTIGNTVFPAGRVVIANNGGLGFGGLPTLPSDDLAPIEEPLPSQAAFGGGQSLLPYWDDLGNTSGDVFYEEFADRLIVQWHDKRLNDHPGTTVRFQAQVFADPVAAARRADGPEQQNGPLGPGPHCYAQLIYFDVQQPGACGESATIGYQDGGSGFNDVQWSHRESGAVRSGTVLSLCVDKGDPCARWNPFTPFGLGGAIITCDRDERLLAALTPGTPPSGVRFELGALQAFRLDWLYFEPDWSPDPVRLLDGAWLELRAIGSRNSLPDQELGALRITRFSGQHFVTVDFAPLGTSLYRLRAYLGGALVTSLNNRSGLVAVAPRWPESGQAGLLGTDVDFTAFWCAPLVLQIPGQPPVLADELRIIAQDPTPAEYHQALEVLASQFTPAVSPPGLERPLIFLNPFITPLRTPGDMNCDGRVDFDDIECFVLALISRTAYYAHHPDCNYDNGDINGDGAVDFNDVDGLVQCLVSGVCP